MPVHPLPVPGNPSYRSSRLVVQEDQDQVLAEELAAVPPEDEPEWEDLEYLEYLYDTGSYDTGSYDTGSGDEEPRSAGPSGPVPDVNPRIPGAADIREWAAFAQGGQADTMSPGPVLATLADRAWQDGLGLLNDDELTGVLQAAHRLGAWAAALELAAVSGLVGRREAEGRATGDWRPFEHADDEIAAALTLTRRGAESVLTLALALDRLPLTRVALAAGAIDERRAWVIADELAGLDDEHAAAVEASIIGKAPGQTTGQLRPAARRAVIAADPGAAKRRKEEALKGARVEASSESSGTAALSGRDLPPAEVLAADKNLTALALGMKKAGAQGTMAQLRARAYLHLLVGHPAETLLAAATAPGGCTSEIPAPRSAGMGTARTGTPGLDLPTLRGTVNLTMPLAAWLGWSESPGHVPGFGTLDADDSRTIAGLLANHPASKWCITLTDLAGRAIGHGCAKNGPGPLGRPGSRPGSGPGSRTDPRPGPRAGPGPSGAPGWISAVTITPLQTGNCTHARETRSYQPGPALRHIIQIRQETCSHPGCRRPATACDLDHTIPHHLGGRTCECGIAPVCRRHHQTKQTPGWALAQHQPGTMTWTTPGDRSYTTQPTCYPA